MREAIGGTWIFTIVIVFIVLFSSYLAISVNYSKAFKVKNGIIDAIDRCNGYPEDGAIDNPNHCAVKAIEDYLLQIGYHVYGNCAASNASDKDKLIETPSKKGASWYCIERISTEGTQLPKVYYKVTVFFKLDLPIIGDIFTFPIYGDTKTIYSPNEKYEH